MSELLFVFALFFVFAVCAVTLLLVSANSYERTVRLTEENYDTRTALAYLSQKIRQNDENDNHIQEIHLNGKVLNRTWITREEITQGGTLEFFLSAPPTPAS